MDERGPCVAVAAACVATTLIVSCTRSGELHFHAMYRKPETVVC